MNRWPKFNPYFWEVSPFFRLLLPLAAGIGCYDLLPVLPENVTWPLLLGFVCTTTALTGYYTRRLKLPLFLVIQLCLFFAGYALRSFYDVKNDPAWYGNHTGTAATHIAVVSTEPKDGTRTWKIQVEVIKAIRKDTVMHTCGSGIVYCYKDELPPLFHKGDTLLLAANWQPVTNAGNPYEFDYARYCRHNNIYYQQFCGRANIRLYAPCNRQARPLIDKLHDNCMQALDKYIPDSRTKGLIQAMLLGDEVNLDPELRQSFTNTGIVHVIAISGGNVMMFFVLIGWALAWIKHRKYDWIKYLLALPLVWLYVVMAGSSPSAVRAAIMFSLLAIGFMLDKNNNALSQLMATAFILLCVQPQWLYALGFQLSFLAVLSLVLFYGPLSALYRPEQKNKVLQWLIAGLWETICASLAAEILVAPLVVYYFHNFPATFLVANVLAFIFMFVVLVLGAGVVIFSWAPPVAYFIGQVDIWLVNGFAGIIKGLQQLEPASFYFLQISGVELVLLYLVLGTVAVFLVRKYKRALFVSLVSLCALMILLCADEYTTLRQSRLVVYNVSKGAHIEMITGRYYYIARTDTAAVKVQYATTAAHTAWHAWRQAQMSKLGMLDINRKSVVILDSARLDTGVHADYVIVNYAGKPAAVEIKRSFTPSMIIVSNNNSRKQQAAWLKAATAAQLPIHITSVNGAFVLE